MTDSAIDPYSSITLIPERQHWPQWLERNLARRSECVGKLPIFDFNRLRSQMVRAARDHRARAASLAERAGVSLLTDGRLDASLDDQALRPFVLTGHQPSILHPGIVYKYDETLSFAASQHATAMAIVMDLDTGSAGEFLVPRASDAQGVLTSPWPVAGMIVESISSSEGLFLKQCIRATGELDDLTERITSGLRSCQAGDAADRFASVMTTYRKLAGCSAVMANSIVRRAHGLSRGMLELPMSELCDVTDVQRWLAQIALEGRSFHHAYNETLNTWRRQRRLRNPANPFPNLDRDGERYELPLWRADLQNQTRHAVWAEFSSSGTVTLFANEERFAQLAGDERSMSLAYGPTSLLVPRGALITILFRLICSDLFVHGLGGQTYDQFTDTLIQHYFGIAPPAFAVASASRYLFESERKRLEQLDQLAVHRRQVEHHPEKYTGQGWLSVEVEEQIAPWMDQKQRLIKALREKKQGGVSAAEEGRRLEQLRDQIKSSIAAALADRLGPLDGLTDAARQAIQSRTYPWFFFAWG
jgi:hypothetical protein